MMEINQDNALKYLLGPWLLSLCFVSVILVVGFNGGDVIASVFFLATIAFLSSLIYIIVLYLLIYKGKINTWKKLQIAQIIGVISLQIAVLIIVGDIAPFLLIPLAYFLGGLIFQWWFWLSSKE